MFHKRPPHCCPPPRPVCKTNVKPAADCGCEAPNLPNMTLPTQTHELPAVVHPTKHNVVESTNEYIVPEIHPTHTTHVNNHVYKHIHKFPHSESVKENVQNLQFCEKPQATMPANVMPSNAKPGNMMPSNVMPTNTKPASTKPTAKTKSEMKPSGMMPFNGYEY
ncbi:spore coat protein [Shouchella rhizosphaerae]|uniref:spore coat protein n=1 Tax=Shouchella rhizosphaerae TaxID=866786 RepID=UPI003F81A44E